MKESKSERNLYVWLRIYSIEHAFMIGNTYAVLTWKITFFTFERKHNLESLSKITLNLSTHDYVGGTNFCAPFYHYRVVTDKLSFIFNNLNKTIQGRKIKREM